VLAVAAALLLTGALAAATRRDVRGGIVAAAAGRTPRTRLLGSVEAFALRRLLRPLAGWSASMGAYFLLIGLIAVTMTEFLKDNPVLADAAGQAGFASLASVAGYAATLFALLAVPVGVFAADRMSAFAAAEADRRLTLLTAQPLPRFRLLGAEIVAVGGGMAVLATVAGLATWLGVTVTGGGLGLPAALAGTWNALPVALLCLGAGVVALGWLPRAVGAVGALPAVGGFLLQVVAVTAQAPQWVIDMSPFAHLAPVPFSPPNRPATAIMTGVALVLVVAGLVGYDRRDLRA
jgi:ABC-2 type transport system permease protein